MFNRLSFLEKINACNTVNALWHIIDVTSAEYQKSVAISRRKKMGVFYTGSELAKIMSKDLLKQILLSGLDVSELKLLEPCVGIGNFIFSYLDAINSLDLKQKSIFKLLNNIYVCDIDENALEIYKAILYRFAKIYYNIELNDTYFKKHIRSSLSFDLSQEKFLYKKYSDVFSDIEEKFDIVITNPPYRNLKANSRNYKDDKAFLLQDKMVFQKISEYVKEKFIYANEGVLNLYKIFVEEIFCNYTKPNAFISLLIPSTILTDKTCTKLRTLVTKNNELISILKIKEHNKYIDAQQALASILIHKGRPTRQVVIADLDNPQKKQVMNYSAGYEPSFELYSISEEEKNVVTLLNKFPKLKDIKYIKNMRGEFDLTLNKNYLKDTKTLYPLIRGRNVYLYGNSVPSNYVDMEFLEKTNKKKFIDSERIVCQQISNIHNKRRLRFTYIKPGYVVANSCNFISLEGAENGLDLYSLLGLFNSSLLNWYFKLMSSNNHINNYELNELPIPICDNILKEISNLVQKYLKEKNETVLSDIDKLVNKAYGLTEMEEVFLC